MGCFQETPELSPLTMKEYIIGSIRKGKGKGVGQGIAIFLLEAQDAARLASYQWNIRARFFPSFIGKSAVGATDAVGNDVEPKKEEKVADNIAIFLLEAQDAAWLASYQ